MPYRYVLVLLTLLASLSARAQLIWQQAMGTAALEETSAGFVAVPGGYLQVGQGGGSGTGSPLPNQLYVSKVTATGTVLWQKTVPVSRNAESLYPIGVSADASGQVYVACDAFPLTSPVPSNPSFGLLVKLSPTGDTLWTRSLATIINASYTRVVTTPDGGAVVIGENGLDQFVAKYSAAGQQLWYQAYVSASGRYEFFSSLALLPGGGFLVRQNVTGPGQPPSNYLVLDAQGQLVATKPTKSYLPYYSMGLDASGSVLDGAGRLYKVSAAGDTLFSRQYVQYGRKVEARIAIEVPGGRYLVGGQRGNGVDYDLSLLLVDKASGAVLRDTLLVRYGGDEFVTGLHVDGQGNYLVGGYTSANGPIGKADQFAFLLRKWDRLLPTRASQETLAGYALYPNPVGAGRPVQVGTPTGAACRGAYELRDALGRLVRSGPALPAGGLPTQGLLAGLYLLRLQADSQWLPALKVQVTD